jgi:hypothetical protein
MELAEGTTLVLAALDFRAVWLTFRQLKLFLFDAYYEVRHATQAIKRMPANCGSDLILSNSSEFFYLTSTFASESNKTPIQTNDTRVITCV